MLPLFQREVLQADHTPLPKTVSLEDIRKGEVNTPEDLVKLFLVSCWRVLCCLRVKSC